MTKFLIDTDNVSNIAEKLSCLYSNINDVCDDISSYDLNDVIDDFDFEGAKKAIEYNALLLANKIDSSYKILNLIIESHTSLQKNLKFEFETFYNYNKHNGSNYNYIYFDNNFKGGDPDPKYVINYWSKKGLINSDDYVYPVDKKTSESLGIWPKDYKNIPIQLKDYKTYNGLIWPTTPVNGNYEFCYNHNGIDITSSFGTPVYAPADGEIIYSKWGDTENIGEDETAYTITMQLDKPVNVGDDTISKVYMTHLSGIRYRCPEGSSQHVKAGELIGYTGVTEGWAPHLHMSMYDKEYDAGLSTSKIEDVYDIKTNTNRKAGE